jgi:DNA-binding NarL/FixJ family response regulator
MKANILIVDDDLSVSKLLGQILTQKTYRCVLASDATEARRLIDRQAFELLLCDIYMPGETGIDLGRYVASTYPDTAIVMVSVETNLEIAAEAMDSGAYGYIIKPFDKYQVLIQVDNALRRRELEIEARSNLQNLKETIRFQTKRLLDLNAALKKRDNEALMQSEYIENINNTLDIIMDRREKDRRAREDTLLVNLKNTFLPYIEKLKKSRLRSDQLQLVNMLETKCQEFASPLVKLLSSQYIGLSPAELQVADLIRHGKQTKEIAQTLCLSHNTILTHRSNIRRKLGLKNSKTNLTTYLLSLE